VNVLVVTVLKAQVSTQRCQAQRLGMGRPNPSTDLAQGLVNLSLRRGPYRLVDGAMRYASSFGSSIEQLPTHNQAREQRQAATQQRRGNFSQVDMKAAARRRL
jgi:hypothetical protein